MHASLQALPSIPSGEAGADILEGAQLEKHKALLRTLLAQLNETSTRKAPLAVDRLDVEVVLQDTEQETAAAPERLQGRPSTPVDGSLPDGSSSAAVKHLGQASGVTVSISLKDDETRTQERYFEQVSVLGKVTAPPWSSKKAIDDGIFKATGFRTRGIMMFKAGKFQANCSSQEEAVQLLRTPLLVHGDPVILLPWSSFGCQHLELLDISTYWLKLPGLPSHLFSSVGRLAGAVGLVVAPKTTQEDMADGHTPTVCVQIPDSSPLPDMLVISRQGLHGAEVIRQPLEFAEMTHRCGTCKQPGHTRRTCRAEPQRNKEALARLEVRPDREESAERPLRQTDKHDPKGKRLAGPRGGRRRQSLPLCADFARALTDLLPPGRKKQVGQENFREGRTGSSCTHKVCMLLQQRHGGRADIWTAFDGNRRSLSMRHLLWEANRRPGRIDILPDLRSLLRSLCRGLSSQDAERLLDSVQTFSAFNPTWAAGEYHYHVGLV